MTDTLIGIDRMLRSVAFDLLSRHDRLTGWKRHRAAFRAESIRRQPELMQDAQDRLRKILAHAYETCPYYTAAWSALGFSPGRPPTPDDLERLPFLTKDVIRGHKADLVSSRFTPEELTLSYTGGTTGTQTSFYLDRECFVTRVGRQWGILERCGYTPGMRRALVWGAHADLPGQGARRTLKRWLRDYASAHEVFCCTVMSEPAMLEYHERLLRFAPDVIYGYPSAIAQLGTFIRDRGLEPIRVSRIITTAERLTETRRSFLREAFGGEVFNLYCSREHGCVAFECARHKGLHIDTGSVFVEIIKDGRRAAAGETGEITITDLRNYGMPFIRSRTGDRGALAPGPCDCGCELPLLTGLDGRSTDIIYRPDGSAVAGLMLTDLFTELPSVRFAQFVQEKHGHLDVYLVATDEFTGEDERAALQEVRELVGEDMVVEIKRVPQITRSSRSGKLREVICTIGETETEPS